MQWRACGYNLIQQCEKIIMGGSMATLKVLLVAVVLASLLATSNSETFITVGASHSKSGTTAYTNIFQSPPVINGVDAKLVQITKAG